MVQALKKKENAANAETFISGLVFRAVVFDCYRGYFRKEKRLAHVLRLPRQKALEVLRADIIMLDLKNKDNQETITDPVFWKE